MTYVGSATSFVSLPSKLPHNLTIYSDEHDQELDSLLVGPIPVGVNKFVFEADPPDTKRIPDAEILGVTVILLTCAYDSREFVRVGYYVNNEYDSEELNADPPAKPILEKVRRNILAEKPRVTRFAIKWFVLPAEDWWLSTNRPCRDSDDSAPAEFPPDQPEADLTADGEEYGAEELEEEEEVEAVEGAAADPDAMVDDAEMAGAEGDPAAAESDNEGSEDLEGESSGSEDEDIEEEEEGEGAGDDAMEMDVEKANGAGALDHHQADAVMAH